MEPDLKPLAVIQDVNQQWVEKMLSHKIGKPVTIHSWKCDLPIAPEGFMSEIAYVKIEYGENLDQRISLQLVIKVMPQEQARRESMFVGGLDKREVLFYRFANVPEFKDLCKKKNIVIQIPDVYYADYLKGDVTLVMNDLTVDKYKSGIVKEGNTLDQTKVALQGIAEFHAAGLAYIKQYGEVGPVAELAEEFKFTCFDYVFGRNLKSLAEMYKGTPLADSMLSLLPYTVDILEMRRRYPLIRTIVHGDYWAGQLMYTEDESKVMMIDWQHCNVDNPSCDVLTMLFMSSHPSVLEDHLDEVLQCYWDSLTHYTKKVGVSLDVTYDQFIKNVDDLMIFGFMAIAISIPEFLGGGNLTPERLLGYVKYLEKKSIVSRYVKMMEDECKQ